MQVRGKNKQIASLFNRIRKSQLTKLREIKKTIKSNRTDTQSGSRCICLSVLFNVFDGNCHSFVLIWMKLARKFDFMCSFVWHDARKWALVWNQSNWHCNQPPFGDIATSSIDFLDVIRYLFRKVCLTLPECSTWSPPKNCKDNNLLKSASNPKRTVNIPEVKS